MQKVVESKIMVNKYAVVKWSFFSSVTQKQAIACFCVFSIACIFSSITMPSISYLEVLLSLFDGYRLDGLNIPEFLRYVILRLAPISVSYTHLTLPTIA